MHSDPAAEGKRVRVYPVLVLSATGTAAVVVAIMVPVLEGFLPEALLRRRLEMGLASLAAAYGILRAWVALSRFRGAPADGPSRWLGRVEAMAGRGLSGGLSIAVAIACAAFLASWLPHYLLWPWWRDSDTFATLAQSWDVGLLPYRDIRGYNFPGAIYLHWLLGKTFGWGRTWALNAIDASALILLGVTMARWSRRCFRGVLPALASYLAFLTFYLSQSYETVAQRDWHTALCVVLALMILQGWPGRSSRVISALLYAAALCTRPHAILFLPALVSAVLEDPDRTDGQSPRDRASPARRLAEWLSFLVVSAAMAFAPLVIAGIADDLVRGLRIASYGGPYSKTDLSTVRREFLDQWYRPGISPAILLMLVVLATTRGPSRRRAATWALALIAALGYRLLHPVQHGYLANALALVGAVVLALPISWWLDRLAVSPTLRAIGLLILIVESSYGIPRFCNPPAALRSLVDLARGETIPAHAPPGTGGWFSATGSRWFAWEDYRKTLLYLRATTASTTLVANVLRNPPFPSINGPTGRVSPFLAESGICWMWLVDMDLDPQFADELERATDSVVVWSPTERADKSRLKLERLVNVIRRRYRPVVRFNQFEVWERVKGTP